MGSVKQFPSVVGNRLCSLYTSRVRTGCVICLPVPRYLEGPRVCNLYECIFC